MIRTASSREELLESDGETGSDVLITGVGTGFTALVDPRITRKEAKTQFLRHAILFHIIDIKKASADSKFLARGRTSKFGFSDSPTRRAGNYHGWLIAREGYGFQLCRRCDMKYQLFKVVGDNRGDR